MPGLPKSSPCYPAPQGSKADPPAGHCGSPGHGLSGRSRVEALPTWMPSWLASSAPTALQMCPRKLYRRQRTDTRRRPCHGHPQDSLGHRDRLLQLRSVLQDVGAEQLCSPAPATYSKRAAIQHSAASIQSPQDTQPSSPARQAAGQAAEPLCPAAIVSSMAGSEPTWAGSAGTHPAGAAPRTTSTHSTAPSSSTGAESTTHCWEQTPGQTKAP